MSRVRDAITEALEDHQRDIMELERCVCGARIGYASVTEHQTTILLGLVKKAQAEAFERGQKSCVRHATRMAAAMELGLPALPGPLSPNPYRRKPSAE